MAGEEAEGLGAVETAAGDAAAAGLEAEADLGAEGSAAEDLAAAGWAAAGLGAVETAAAAEGAGWEEEETEAAGLEAAVTAVGAVDSAAGWRAASSNPRRSRTTTGSSLEYSACSRHLHAACYGPM